RTACDIRDLVRNIVENYRPVANSKNVVLTSQVDASLPPLYADGRRLDQVLNNLLSNAVKFTPEGGAIQIRVRPENGAGVMVQVEDSAVESKDGLSGLQTLQHEKIDAVISDILSLILPQNRASRNKPTRYPGTNTPMRIAG